MPTIRPYTESDAAAVGRLIAETYRAYNLAWVSEDEVGAFLGPFRHAGSPDPTHQAAVAQVIRSQWVWVAEEEGAIVGVLRGREGRLGSLFVCGDCHRRGIGRALVMAFEAQSRAQGVAVVHVAATQFAVPFYLALGYRRSTGLRSGYSFEGRGLPVQPMRKVLEG